MGIFLYGIIKDTDAQGEIIGPKYNQSSLTTKIYKSATPSTRKKK